MPKVSIIIPVYNAAAFIDTTILSLQAQTLQDCEFIFVNDGSTDNSSAVIEKYAATDSRIKLTGQHNQGISTARNNGIAMATGEYITFMDNDDYVKPDMYEVLYTNAIKDSLDIVVSVTILGRDGKYIVKGPVFPVDVVYDNAFAQDSIIANLLKCEDMFAVWNKLFKRAFIEQYGIRFPANREIEEDSMFNFAAFSKAQRIKFIEYSGYYYRDVAVNESRKLIERDYFKRATERYLLDYKTVFRLAIDHEEAQRLKAIRFVHRVFYLIFRCSLEKNTDARTRYAYVKNMMASPLVQQTINRYSTQELEVYGRFEKVLLGILKKQSATGLFLLVKALQTLYSPRVSELLRKLNNTRTGSIHHDS
jgi:glycosyltransferase involved in cell wall biosynthesis